MTEKDAAARTKKLGKALLILLLPLAIGGGVRLFTLGDYALWVDEVTTILICKKVPAEIIHFLSFTHHAPPLFYFILHFTTYLGKSAYLLRLPSALLGTASIPLFYVAGKALFGRLAGMGGALLLALSSFHICHSQEVRMYSLVFFTCLLSYHALWIILQGGGGSAYLEYGVSLVLSLYSHYLFVFVVFTQVGTFLLFQFFSPLRSGERGKGVRKKALRSMGVTFLCVGAACSFWLPFLFQRVKAEYIPFNPLRASDLDWAFFYLNLKKYTSLSSHALNALFCLFFLTGCIWGFWQKRRETLLLVFWAFLPTAMILFFVLAYGSFFSSRYILFSLPPWLLLASKGIQVWAIFLARRFVRIVPPRILQHGGILLYMGLLSPLLLALFSGMTESGPNRQGIWKTNQILALEISKRFQEGDRVIYFPHSQNSRVQELFKICLDYYLDEYTGQKIETYSFSTGGMLDPVVRDLLAPIVPAHDRRWVVTEQFQDPSSAVEGVVTFQEVFSAQGRVWAVFDHHPRSMESEEARFTTRFYHRYGYKKELALNLGKRELWYKKARQVREVPEKVLVLYSPQQR